MLFILPYLGGRQFWFIADARSEQSGIWYEHVIVCLHARSGEVASSFRQGRNVVIFCDAMDERIWEVVGQHGYSLGEGGEELLMDLPLIFYHRHCDKMRARAGAIIRSTFKKIDVHLNSSLHAWGGVAGDRSKAGRPEGR
jgi:hypothetical protein